jgi:hypothetical protein
MKKYALFAFTCALTFAVALGISACGGDEDGCPGIVCSSCAAGSDCNITCGAGENEFCGHFGFFEDPNLRCNFCDSRDDPFAKKAPLEP